MNKPIIIVICGKSATGKDTLAKQLKEYLPWPSQRIVSDTTRSPRRGEVDGIDYNFILQSEFLEKQYADDYLEWTYFNTWYYGTPKSCVYEDYINIGVFDAKGVQNLYKKYSHKYRIIPIYLKENIFVRIQRSFDREGVFHFEYLRRAIADAKDFFNFENKTLKKFPDYLVLKHEINRLGRCWKINSFLRQLNIELGNIE